MAHILFTSLLIWDRRLWRTMCSEWIEWIELIWTWINVFETFNGFIMMKRILKTVLIFFLRTFQTVSRKPCINRESKRRILQFSYTFIVVTRTMIFLTFLTPPPIYHGCSIQKKFWEDKSTLVNMTSGGSRNVRKHREINKGDQYIILDIYFNIDCLDKREVTSSESSHYVVIPGKGLDISLTLRTKFPNKK